VSTTLTQRITALPLWEIRRLTKEDGEREYFTPTGPAFSVTTILSGSQVDSSIEEWRESVGYERADALRDAAAYRGTKHHDAIEKFLVDRQEPPFSFLHTPYWNSSRPFLDTIETVLLSEATVWHPEGYAGSLDCLAYLVDDDLQPTLLDWKTADSVRNAKKMYEYSMQVAAYTYAANHVYRDSGLDIQRAKIVVAIPDSNPQIKTIPRDELDQLYLHFLARKERFTYARSSKR